jgi:hypothetical protein
VAQQQRLALVRLPDVDLLPTSSAPREWMAAYRHIYIVHQLVCTLLPNKERKRPMRHVRRLRVKRACDPRHSVVDADNKSNFTACFMCLA